MCSICYQASPKPKAVLLRPFARPGNHYDKDTRGHKEAARAGSLYNIGYKGTPGSLLMALYILVQDELMSGPAISSIGILHKVMRLQTLGITYCGWWLCRL